MKRTTILFATLILVAMTACENPVKSRIYMDQGSELMLRYGKYDEAEKTLTKAIRYDKNNHEAYYYRGCAKVNAKKFNEALEDFQKAVDIKPDYADAYFNMGRTYYLMNNFDKACEYYHLADQYGRPNLEDYLKRCE